MTGVLIIGKFGLKGRQMHRRASHEDGGRDFHDASTSQGTLRTVDNQEPLGIIKKVFFPTTLWTP